MRNSRWALAVLLLLGAYSCKRQPAMVSDVAPLYLRFERSGHNVYMYRGIRVIGDMTITEFEGAVSVLQDKLAEGEQFIVISSPHLPGWAGEIRVETCTICDAGELGGKGRIFYLKRIHSRWAIVKEADWIS